MTSQKNQSNAKYRDTTKQDLKLITILPPFHTGNEAFFELFPDAMPIIHKKPGRQQQELDAVPRYYDRVLGFNITNITPLGHRNFNHTLLSSRADIALIIIDAAFGLEKRNFWAKALSCLAAIPNIIIAIDNMSLVDFSKKRYEKLRDEFGDHLFEVNCKNIKYVPIDLSAGDNLHHSSSQMKWYDGAPLIPILSNLGRADAAEMNSENLIQKSDQFSIYLSWFSTKPLMPGRRYLLDNGSEKTKAHISTLKYRLNPETMEHQAADFLFPGNVGYGNISLEKEIAFDPFTQNRETGSFKLKDLETGKFVAFALINHALNRATNIHWQALEIGKDSRAASMQQKPFVLWFTGLSGSGKSTVASIIEKKLHAEGKHTYLLDGDNIRHGLCRDLGFTDVDRVENIRRISETAKLFIDAGLIVLVSFISPFRSERKAARELFADGEFFEVFVDTAIEICEARDPKGLYKKARAGLLKNFTGIDSSYEPPENPDIVLTGDKATPEELADKVIVEMENRVGSGDLSGSEASTAQPSAPIDRSSEELYT